MPAGYAVLAWWFTTGVILFLDGLPRRTFRWSLIAATLVLLASFYALSLNIGDTSIRGAYVGFTCAILIWGWLEMSFLMGFVTGPRTHGCNERCHGWRHFVHAIEAIIYNELATCAVGAGIFLLTRHGVNDTAWWTFLILWVMRVSAKLNLFLGVPNLGEKFLPPHLQYLKAFFRKRSMNLLFPLSITASTLAAAVLLGKCLMASDPFRVVSNSLLLSLLSLAVLEHWFMVIPLPTERLWRWSSKSNTDSIAVKAP